MLGDFATILKRGRLVNEKANELRKGDMVVIQTGDFIPADLELIQHNELEIDEFEITGEIFPIRKDSIGEILFMGSKVVRGTGQGIVVATGEQTDFGKITKQEHAIRKSAKLEIIKGKYFWLLIILTPGFLLIITRTLNIFYVLLLLTCFSIIIMILQNDLLFRKIIFSISLNHLTKLGIQIKYPAMLEKLADTDIICFDKTGVLTSRDMRVRKIFLDDKSYEPNRFYSKLPKSTAALLSNAFALCNDVRFFERFNQADPIDSAIIRFAQEIGIDFKNILTKYPRVYEKPFSSENRFMAAGFKISGHQNLLFIKGDAEIIIRMCNKYLQANGDIGIIKSDKRFLIRTTIEDFQKNGGTVIGFAYNMQPPEQNMNNNIFIGLLLIENPLNKGSRTIIQFLRKIGLRSILLSGDQPETTKKIGKDVGITPNASFSLTGRMMDAMDLDEIARQAEYCSIFSRLTPSQKGLIILKLQQKGHHVVMIGDGFNDAIALKVADIGISFIYQSSAAARKNSVILIPDLTFFLPLLKNVRNAAKLIQKIKIIRLIILAASFFITYSLAFS